MSSRPPGGRHGSGTGPVPHAVSRPRGTEAVDKREGSEGRPSGDYPAVIEGILGSEKLEMDATCKNLGD